MEEGQSLIRHGVIQPARFLPGRLAGPAGWAMLPACSG